MIIKKPFYHFSIHDVFETLIDVSDKKQNLFDSPFFAFLKELNSNYGTNVDLYLFYEKNIRGEMRTLKDVSSSLRNTIEKNPWLRFGPHALNFESRPYEEEIEELKKTLDGLYKEINRFAGNNNMSQLLCLHWFSEMFELSDYFTRKGVKALIITDSDEISWRMTNKEKKILKEKGMVNYKGMDFVSSHLRAEFYGPKASTKKETNNSVKEKIENILGRHGFLIFLTHEVELENKFKKETKAYIQTAIEHLYKKNIPSI